MSSSGRSVLSVYAREILELHPIWRFRGLSGPDHGAGHAGQPSSESPAAEVQPLSTERIYCWSVCSAPVSAGLREAVQRAAALALAPAGSLVLHWQHHLLPEATVQTDAQPSTATAEGPLSLPALQRWLVTQQTGPQSEALPRLVLVWGAEFSGPVAAEAAAGTWLLGLPLPGQFSTAAARRQTWADLLALKRLLT